MEDDMTLADEAQDLSLYKFHLELVFKVAAFSFGITGALVSYYLTNTNSESWLRYSLVLPALMNVGLAVLCALSAPSAMELRRVNRTYELVALPILLWLFAALYGLIAVGLVTLFVAVGRS